MTLILSILVNAQLINATAILVIEKLFTLVFDKSDVAEAIKELDPYSLTPDGDIPAHQLLR